VNTLVTVTLLQIVGALKVVVCSATPIPRQADEYSFGPRHGDAYVGMFFALEVDALHPALFSLASNSATTGRVRAGRPVGGVFRLSHKSRVDVVTCVEITTSVEYVLVTLTVSKMVDIEVTVLVVNCVVVEESSNVCDSVCTWVDTKVRLKVLKITPVVVGVIVTVCEVIFVTGLAV